MKYFAYKYHGLHRIYTELRAPPAPGGEVAHTRHAAHENPISQTQLERNNPSKFILYFQFCSEDEYVKGSKKMQCASHRVNCGMIHYSLQEASLRTYPIIVDE